MVGHWYNGITSVIKIFNSDEESALEGNNSNVGDTMACYMFQEVSIIIVTVIYCT